MKTPKHEKSATRKKKVIMDHHAKTCQNMKRVQHGKSATRKKHKQ